MNSNWSIPQIECQGLNPLVHQCHSEKVKFSWLLCPKEQAALTVARPLIFLNRGTLPNGSLVFYEICSLSQVLTPWITSWGFVVNVVFYFNLRVIPYYLTICWKCLNSTVWVQTLIGAACLIDKHNHGGGLRVTPTEFRFTRVWQIPVWKSENHSHSSL